jgi:hypothetical protein
MLKCWLNNLKSLSNFEIECEGPKLKRFVHRDTGDLACAEKARAPALCAAIASRCTAEILY